MRLVSLCLCSCLSPMLMHQIAGGLTGATNACLSARLACWLKVLFASVALLLYLAVEPGLVRDIAFTTALTGSVSTLLFNANPLLKFDGYQILQDAVDMPNLARRSVLYLQYLVRRYLFQVKSARSPATGTHERRWLLVYGVFSLVFRWIITLGIAVLPCQSCPVYWCWSRNICAFPVGRQADFPWLRLFASCRRIE